MIEFDWDPQKARANLEKHGISFEEAKSVFFDEYARQFFDEEHSSSEERFIMLGLSNVLRVLVVCHCERSGGSLGSFPHGRRQPMSVNITKVRRYEERVRFFENEVAP